MQYDFNDIFDGAVQGEAILEVRKAELKALPDGRPLINISYVVVDAEPQGEAGLSAVGEFVNHTVWLPYDSEGSEKVHNKKKMLKAFLKAHGIDTSQPVGPEDIVDFFNSNSLQVGAICEEDSYALKERGVVQTRVKAFKPL
jgi:hypothetical protein